MESITITSEKTQLSKTDIARMVYESHEFSQRDQESHRRSLALNKLQELVGVYSDSYNSQAV